MIDLHEFSRWYFTGMQSYSDGKRTLLKIGHKTKSIFSALKGGSKSAILDQELKVKTHTLKVSFNEPSEIKSSIGVDLFFGGEKHTQILNSLKAQYHDATPLGN